LNPALIVHLQIVVPKTSATLEYSGAINTPLNGNHIEIVKYSSKKDDNVISVAGNIAILAKSVYV